MKAPSIVSTHPFSFFFFPIFFIMRIRNLFDSIIEPLRART